MNKFLTIICAGLVVVSCGGGSKSKQADKTSARADSTIAAQMPDTAKSAMMPAYVGTFEGTLPDGKQTLMLAHDMTYRLTDKSGAAKSGRFTMSGDTLTLVVGERKEHYMLGNGYVEKLKKDGKPYSDAEKYKLKKVSN